MSYSLVIVESPAKAKTITNFLENTIVEASKGHIRDLPKYVLGVKFDNDKVICSFDITKDHRQIVKRLQELASRANKIYIATDEDREGEAIGYHIATILKQDIKTVDRIAFHEITKSAIRHAIENPRKLNLDMVNSQIARRVLDRVVGFSLSSLLASKISRGLTAGRVQSSTLSLVVDREREINAFKPIKYYLITGNFEETLLGNLTHVDGKKLEQTELTDLGKVNTILNDTGSRTFKVISIEKTTRKVKPNPPFTTSTLQQTASNKLGFTPETTMRIAQRLYEGVETTKGKMGVITYMRTDSLNIAKEAQFKCRDFIKNNYGDEYLSPTVRFYTTNSKGAQEAHEAIRPTHLEFTPEIAQGYLEPEQLKLYSLIYYRFLATQSTEAVFENTKCKVSDQDGKYIFEANGSINVFQGFQKFTGVDAKTKILPDFKEGYEFKTKEIKSEEKETNPPARYTEASLVSTMEKLGIGRPSTYAATTSLLLKRKFVVKEGKSLKATNDAFLIVDTLRKYFPNIVDIKFTADMEANLDDIASGSMNWEKFLINFNTEFSKDLSNAKTNMASLKKEPTPTGEKCPQCGGDMVTRSGRFGEFESCNNYPKCKYIKPKEIKVEALVLADFKCPKCKSDVYEKVGKFGKYFECSKRSEKKCDFINKHKPIDGKSCEKCGGYMVMKFGKPVCPKCNPATPRFKKPFPKKK